MRLVRSRSPAALAQRGYVLVATLAVLALMALVAGRLAGRLDALREQSLTLEALADGLLAADNARARLLHRMTTEPITMLGLGAEPATRLPVDAAPIPLPGGVTATLQDHRGLLSVNVVDRALLTRLMTAQGVPTDRIDRLLDTLADYADTDDLRRLDGAEENEYRAEGLLPPRNDWLDSAEELRQIIGWRDDPEALSRLIPLLSSRRNSWFNPNTAPREVLAARLPGASPQQLDAFISRRRAAPFRSPAEATTATGFLFDDNDVFHPSDFYRLRLQPKGLPVALEYNVLLTPQSQIRPWQIVDSRTVFVPVSTRDDGGAQLQPGAGVARAGAN